MLTIGLIVPQRHVPLSSLTEPTPRIEHPIAAAWYEERCAIAACIAQQMPIAVGARTGEMVRLRAWEEMWNAAHRYHIAVHAVFKAAWSDAECVLPFLALQWNRIDPLVVRMHNDDDGSGDGADSGEDERGARSSSRAFDTYTAASLVVELCASATLRTALFVRLALLSHREGLRHVHNGEIDSSADAATASAMSKKATLSILGATSAALCTGLAAFERIADMTRAHVVRPPAEHQMLAPLLVSEHLYTTFADLLLAEWLALKQQPLALLLSARTLRHSVVPNCPPSTRHREPLDATVLAMADRREAQALRALSADLYGVACDMVAEAATSPAAAADRHEQYLMSLACISAAVKRDSVRSLSVASERMAKIATHLGIQMPNTRTTLEHLPILSIEVQDSIDGSNVSLAALHRMARSERQHETLTWDVSYNIEYIDATHTLLVLLDDPLYHELLLAPDDMPLPPTPKSSK